MYYQKMIVGEKPYRLFIHHNSFTVHRHPEIELAYCLKNKTKIVINNITYTVKKGDLAIINSMLPHEYMTDACERNHLMIIEAGPVMLSNFYNIIANYDFKNPVISFEDDNNHELKSLLSETALLLEKEVPASELLQKSNIYKIFAYIIDTIYKYNNTSTPRNQHAYMQIEKAFELIYSKYNEDLRTEKVAELCGYSMSGFCKIFKKLTGTTFHTILNQHRVDISCKLLRETANSIEEIATQVGFADSKSYCRVFKNLKGISPGKYKKNNDSYHIN